MFFKSKHLIASLSLVGVLTCSACSFVTRAAAKTQKQIKCINVTELFYEKSSGSKINPAYLVGNYDDYFKKIEKLGRFKILGNCTITMPPAGQKWVDCIKINSIYYRSYNPDHTENYVLSDVLKAEVAGNISVRSGTTFQWRGSCLVKSNV